MALVHEFKLKKECLAGEFDEMKEDVVQIQDELVLYIVDTLAWIDTEWNYQIEKRKGLNYYGITNIKKESINYLRDIIKGWTSIFQLAPQDVFLTGAFDLDENEYEIICLKKQKLIIQMEELCKLCDDALAMDAEIVHIGI